MSSWHLSNQIIALTPQTAGQILLSTIGLLTWKWCGWHAAASTRAEASASHYTHSRQRTQSTISTLFPFLKSTVWFTGALKRIRDPPCHTCTHQLQVAVSKEGHHCWDPTAMAPAWVPLRLPLLFKWTFVPLGTHSWRTCSSYSAHLHRPPNSL